VFSLLHSAREAWSYLVVFFLEYGGLAAAVVGYNVGNQSTIAIGGTCWLIGVGLMGLVALRLGRRWEAADGLPQPPRYGAARLLYLTLGAGLHVPEAIHLVRSPVPHGYCP
jgi:hypothetical protein